MEAAASPDLMLVPSPLIRGSTADVFHACTPTGPQQAWPTLQSLQVSQLTF